MAMTPGPMGVPFAKKGSYTLLATEMTARPFQANEDFWTCVHESTLFQAFMTVLIVANAVVIGLETDMPTLENWNLIQNVFLGIFLVELLLKMKVQTVVGFFKFSNADFGWNVFDCIVVTLGVTDSTMSVLFDRHAGSMATMFRTVRLLRIMRLVRIFKFLKKLLLLAVGFVEAAQAVAWVTVLMSVALYMCSIVMVRTCGQLPEDEPHAEFLHERFYDIRTSMITLFVLMSSPNLETYLEQDGLVWERPMLLMFLIVFVIMGSFGMTALLTGVISESMFEKNQVRLEEARKETDEMITFFEERADVIHGALNLNEKGEASREEILHEAMPQVAKMFSETMIEFNHHALEELVEVMDINSSGLIDPSEFKRAIVTYAAGVKPLSIQEVHFAVSQCLHKVSNIEEALKQSPSIIWDLGEEDPSMAKALRQVPSQDKPSRLSSSAQRDLAPVFGVGLDNGDSFEEVLAGILSLGGCMRECVEKQLTVQRDFEASLRRKMDELSKDLKEELKSVSDSWRQLPGGYLVGERVVSTIDYKINSGSICRGDVGTVRGFSTGEDRKRINVDFPNLRSVNMLPTQIRRRPLEKLPASSPLEGKVFAVSEQNGQQLAAKAKHFDGDLEAVAARSVQQLFHSPGVLHAPGSFQKAPPWSGPGGRASLSHHTPSPQHVKAGGLRAGTGGASGGGASASGRSEGEHESPYFGATDLWSPGGP